MRAPQRRENRRPWVCLWGDCLDSRSLAQAGEGAELLFYRLLALCGQSGEGDTINDATAEALAWRFRGDAADFEGRLARLQAVNAIERSGPSVRIIGWFDRQPAESEAERSRRRRDEMRRPDATAGGDQTSDRVTTGSRPEVTPSRRPLDADADAEKTQTQNTPAQPPGDSGGAKPVPTAAMPVVRINPNGKAGTSDDLRPFFDAYCRGAGQKLSWGHKYVLYAEQIHRHGKPPDRIATVAAFYRAKLKDAVPSIQRFASEIDKWDAECGHEHAASAGKTAEEWRSEGRCPRHPGEMTTDGPCELCTAIEEFHGAKRA